MCELTIKRENGFYPDPLYTAQIEYIVSVLHQNEGGIGKSIPDAEDQEIHPCGQGRIDSVKISPSLLRMRECPFSRVSGNLSGVGDGFPNTSLVLVEHGYNTSLVLVEYGHSPHHQSIYRDGSGNPSLWAGKN